MMLTDSDALLTPAKIPYRKSFRPPGRRLIITSASIYKTDQQLQQNGIQRFCSSIIAQLSIAHPESVADREMPSHTVLSDLHNSVTTLGLR